MPAIPLLAPDPVGARTLILGGPTPTNGRLAAAFVVAGFECALGEPASIPLPARGDLVLARLDVLPSLDGILEVNGAVEFTADYTLRGVDPFAAAVRALRRVFDTSERGSPGIADGRAGIARTS
jgi:hypothetical protein